MFDYHRFIAYRKTLELNRLLKEAVGPFESGQEAEKDAEEQLSGTKEKFKCYQDASGAWYWDAVGPIE